MNEYFNAVKPNEMMTIFASLLHERRIVVTSSRLSRLTACVQAVNTLMYPMSWQHIFIPVLHKKLVDYLSAPMPFLIGVPLPLMKVSLRAKRADSKIRKIVEKNTRKRNLFKKNRILNFNFLFQLFRLGTYLIFFDVFHFFICISLLLESQVS